MNKITLLAGLVFVVAALTANAAEKAQPAGRAGGITPENDQQKAAFDAATRAVAQAGYGDGVVVGVSKDTPAIFVVAATRGQKNILLAIAESSAKQLTRPVELEPEMLPNDRVKALEFKPFLDSADLIDILVEHQPMQLESSHAFQRHHILRRSDKGLSLACTFNGDSKSGYAKGPRSVGTVRTVTVEKVSDSKMLAFDVKAVEVRTEKNNIGSGAPTTDRTETTTRYELTSAGTFQPVGK